MPPTTRGRWSSLLKGLCADFCDVSCIFEGNARFVGKPGLVDAKHRQELDPTFQGNYFYRRDEAVFLDLYKRGGSPLLAVSSVFTVKFFVLRRRPPSHKPDRVLLP